MKQLFSFALVICFSLSVFAQEAKSEKPIWGAGIEMFYSANAHGAFYSGHLSYNKSKHHLKIGPLIHKRSLKVSGAKLAYSYVLAGMDAEEMLHANFRESSNGSWRVSLMAFVQYIDKTQMNYKRVVEEELLNPDRKQDWNKVYLSTLEGGLGAELDVKLFNYLQLRTYVGVSVYSHVNYPTVMYHEKTAAAFIFGAGINVPTFKGKSKQ